ncbi:MAG: von Willebrand factor type A domain-containing protein [Gemmatimonadaceae bacterium]
MVRSLVSSMVGLSFVAITASPPRPSSTPFSSPVLYGAVTAASTGAPVAGAQVAVLGLRVGAVTDSVGRWSMRLSDSLRRRTVTLDVRVLGYQRAKQSVRIDNDSVRVDIALTPAALSLEQVVVTGAATVTKHAYANSTVAAPAGVMPSRNLGARRDAEWNTESYDRIDENPFRSARDVPLSTFSVDVDRAAYSNVRRYIRSGQLPPPDAVRLEEMINYFPYDYAPPTGDRTPIKVVADVAVAPWAAEHRLVRVALRARDVDAAKLPPSNLVFLVDVSGSMSDPNKLPLLKNAFLMLVDQLREDDHVAIVVYAGAAGLVLPSTPGSNKAQIREALERLEAGGSTAGGAGIRLAYDVAKASFIHGGNNRVILATDGDFNVGVSSDGEMERLIEEKRADGTFLTVLGFGMGNYKDSKLEKLADRGNGNYAYIDSPLEARKVFVHELGGTLLTVAKDVKIQVEFNPARVASYRLLGYENRRLNDEDFTNDAKDAGDMGAGHTVTALYEVVPTGAAIDPSLPTGDLRYQEGRQVTKAAASGELMQVKVRYKERDGTTSRELRTVVADESSSLTGDFAFASAVAEFAMLARDSKFRGHASLDHVLAQAESARGADPHGYRREFVELVQRYRELQVQLAAHR